MPFPPTPSNTPSNTATPSNTPSNTPPVTPSNSSCFPASPTPTPTETTTNTPTPTETPTNTPTSVTPTPTNTLTPTPTPTATSGCECYYYDVVTYEEDILRASGNTGTNLFRNGLVWVSYRNCDDNGFTDATFDNTESPYQNAICVNGLEQYNPPTIFIWQDNVQTTEILSFVVKGGCCTPPPITVNGTDILVNDFYSTRINKYDPITNEITYLFSAATGSYSDIAATTNKIFLNSSIGNILQYSYTGSPNFNVVYDTTYTGFPPDGVGLTAKDNNYLYRAYNDVKLLNLSAGTYSTLFSLSGICDSGECYTSGDIAWNSSKNQFAITYYDNITFDFGIALVNSTGGTLYNLSLSGFSDTTYPDLVSSYGVYAYNDKVWIGTNYFYLYEVDFTGSTISLPIQPNNLALQTISGANNATENINWDY